MQRKIIHIDTEQCTGCGACAEACHEGAIGMVNGKAKLLREDYCDGLGDCLPACPVDAIHFAEREAPARPESAASACPGSQVRSMKRTAVPLFSAAPPLDSQLAQWPCQLRLAPASAPYFQGASLLIAADCTAFAYAGIHPDFMRGKVTLIGCPKLDPVDYSEKLTAIFRENDIRSITVLCMEVPCCGGLGLAVKKALEASGKMIPWQVTTVNIDGSIAE